MAVCKANDPKFVEYLGGGAQGVLVNASVNVKLLNVFVDGVYGKYGKGEGLVSKDSKNVCSTGGGIDGVSGGSAAVDKVGAVSAC